MNAIETSLYSKLTGTAALTTALGGAYIYNRVAPQGQAPPYVVFNHSGGGHENITKSDMQNHVYMVKVVTSGPQGSKLAGTINDLVIAALHNSTLTITGYTNFWTALEEEVQFTETAPDGTYIFHTGGYYRIRIDA
jgi:Protein of unknown function (DUF3168)